MIKINCQSLSPEENGHRRLRLAAAFMAGMAVTAILSQAPALSRLLSPAIIREPASPNYLKGSDRSDILNPPGPIIGELVGFTNHDFSAVLRESSGRHTATQPV